MLSVIILSVVILSVIMLIVIKLSVIMLVYQTRVSSGLKSAFKEPSSIQIKNSIRRNVLWHQSHGATRSATK
jgi:hypothetical protein